MSVASQNRRPFTTDSVKGKGKNQLKPIRRTWGILQRCRIVFAKKSLTETERYAGALSWPGNQMFLFHISGHFLLTVSLRWQRMPVYLSLLTIIIPANYTGKFREHFEAM